MTMRRARMDRYLCAKRAQRTRTPAMSESKAQRNQALKKAFEALLEKDPAKAQRALLVIRAKGDPSSVLPLLQALAATDDDRRKKRIEQLLHEVKVAGAAQELGKALDMPELGSVRKTVIAAFWNAHLDALPYTERLVDIAVEGDPEETIEVLTVVEQMTTVPADLAERSVRKLEKALQQQENSYMKALLEELASVLEQRAST